MKRIFSGFAILNLGLFLCSCATTHLTNAGSGVKLTTRYISPTCDDLGRVVGQGGYGEHAFPSYKAAKNEMLNQAGGLGANYVFLQRSDENTSYSTFIGEAFRCSPLVELSQGELDKRCFERNADACLDLYARLYSSNFSQAVKALNQSCGYGNSRACRIAESHGLDNATFQKQWRLKEECDKGNSKSCLERAFMAYKFGEIDIAIDSSQQACLKGLTEGCEFGNKIIEERATRSTAQAQQAQSNRDFERAALIYQNAAAQQSNDSMVQALQNLGNATKPVAQPKETNCTTKSRPNLTGQAIYDTQCTENP